MLDSVQGKIASDVPDRTNEFPMPGKLTISAGLSTMIHDFSRAKGLANQALDLAKKKRASIATINSISNVVKLLK